MLKVAIDSFSYDQSEILKDIHFSSEKGEHIAVLGESGCGKSTLLHLIYGLLHLEHGTIFWNNKELLGPKFNLIPGEDFMKLVAQEANVMPFISVAENVATYLSRQNEKEEQQRVAELLEVVELSEFKETLVKNLSGGQKQRVALAKALAKKPEVLLLDEPFSHIDSFKKNGLRRKVFFYLKKEKISCITATHDAEEALAFSDKILLIKSGTLERYETPLALYNTLQNTYQAGFFADLPSDTRAVFKNEKYVLLPHQIEISDKQTKLKATVVQSLFFGDHYIIEAKVKSNIIHIRHSEYLVSGSTVYIAKKTPS